MNENSQENTPQDNKEIKDTEKSVDEDKEVKTSEEVQKVDGV